MLQVEALCMWALGTAIGLGLAVLVVSTVGTYGIGIPQEAGEMLGNTFLVPERFHMVLDAPALTLAPAVLGGLTSVAAFLVSLRLRRIRPVAALREVE